MRALARLFGCRRGVAADTEVMRNLLNLETALIIDVTGSMAGQRITDLREAAKALVDIVVWDDQTDYYSKVALVPYSLAVNVGAFAEQVRGPTVPGKPITGATRDDPVVITAPGHGFTDGDTVYITGVSGMSQINGRSFRVDDATANTFELRNVDGDNYGNYISGGMVHCTEPGCEYYRFTNANGDRRIFSVSTCATERTGTNAYTDVAPSTALLGMNYDGSGNPCPAATILPLTNDKALLKSRIDAVQAVGSTAGHLGAA